MQEIILKHFKQKFMRKISLIILLSIISVYGFSQNAKQKVIFIYSFTKYISWPAGNNQGDFLIGIYGNPEVSKELKIIAAKRKVGIRNIKVLDFSSIGNLQNCHIVYVAANKISDLSKIISNYNQKATIVVTNTSGAIQKGAGINFLMVGGKQKFEIRKANIEKNGLKVNSQLINLGIVK